MPLASITSHLESLIGDHGLYAVFGLMFIDAVLPAASELVMVYAGALAAGAFASQNVVLFGQRLDSGWPAYLAVALAGTIGYTLGSIMGWAIGFYGGRPYSSGTGAGSTWTRPSSTRADAWFERYGDAAVLIGRITPVIRSFVAIPAGIARMPLGPLHRSSRHRLGDLVLRSRRHRLGARLELGELPQRLPVRRLRDRRPRRRGRRAPARPAPVAPPARRRTVRHVARLDSARRAGAVGRRPRAVRCAA